ncbi:hypothetical protein HGP14_29090 [Rhizobium sp. P32RR-XVIII]|uniref:MaoC/PaaZ C-terminal domain-containing protein n=1 Tax=Rhizobium sp. P32RR-XVIII TaxID=2726738 RepID=UPI0014576AE0|nr:MaoC/PaaZ C-terminal domain-containing protein [Rhizobium sp. P32RR-XVIII]NLS07339.1 hypothetical protein [Rhizobium sp. P32RR-XVIII]
MDNWNALPDLQSRKVGEHLRDPIFENVVVPEEAAPVRYTADDAAINAYCYALNCQDPWYFRDHSAFSGRIAPSAMILKELMWFYQTQYDRSRVRGFHQHEDFVFHAPVPAGTELIFSGRNTEKFTKRGKGYFRHASEARDESGRLYVSQINTELFDLNRSGIPDDPDSRERVSFSTAWDDSLPILEKIAEDPPRQGRLPLRTMSFDRGQMAIFSGFVDEFVNLHTDRRIAREMGFTDVVVQGLMSVCWLSEELTRLAGMAWLSGGSMSASFLRPMLASQTATVQTTVARDETLVFESTFLNAQGQTQAIALSKIT